MAHRGERDFGFFQWTAVGVTLVFGMVGLLSVGGPFFVIGLVLLGFMLGRGPRWPAPLGVVAGIGVVAIVLSLIGSRDEPGIWAASGMALIGLSATVFWWLRCRTTT